MIYSKFMINKFNKSLFIILIDEKNEGSIINNYFDKLYNNFYISSLKAG